MYCPKCGSSRVKEVEVTTTSTETNVKGFGWIKACIGWLLFSIPGILCGFCGMGKGKTRTVTNRRKEHVCENCGYRF